MQHPRRPVNPLLRRLKHFIGDTRAATAVEYGLIVSLIVIAMVASLQGLANTTTGMWGNINSKVANANGG